MDLGGGAKVLGLIMLRATRRPNKEFFWSDSLRRVARIRLAIDHRDVRAEGPWCIFWSESWKGVACRHPRKQADQRGGSLTIGDTFEKQKTGNIKKTRRYDTASCALKIRESRSKDRVVDCRLYTVV